MIYLGSYVLNDDGQTRFDGFWKKGSIINGTRTFQVSSRCSSRSKFQSKFGFQDGRIYRGYFKNLMFHGNGTLMYPNGTKLEGQFFHGEPHGKISKMIFALDDFTSFFNLNI